jgi:hypothetical protein
MCTVPVVFPLFCSTPIHKQQSRNEEHANNRISRTDVQTTQSRILTYTEATQTGMQTTQSRILTYTEATQPEVHANNTVSHTDVYRSNTT